MKTILLWCFVLSGVCLQAQNYLWARNYVQLTNDNSNGITCITTDIIGNAYVCGDYYGLVRIGGDSSLDAYNNNQQNQYHEPNHFIAKIEPNGQTDWIRNVLNDSIYNIYAIQADVNSNVYYSYGGSTEAKVSVLAPNGTSQVILSMTSSYVYSNSPSINTLTLKDSFLYMSGFFDDSLYIGDTILTSPYYYSGAFIAKFNLNTNRFSWARLISSIPSVANVTGMIADTSGNIFMSGIIGWSLYGGGGTDTAIFDGFMIASNVPVSFVAKINASGNYQWVKQYGTPSSYTNLGICMDNQENVYYASVNTNNSFFFQTSAFLVKLSSSGQEIWNKPFPFSTGWLGIAASGDAIYLLQNYRSDPSGSQVLDTLYAGVDTTIINTNNSNSIMCLDTAGRFRWLAPYPYNNSSRGSNSLIAASKNGIIYSTGKFDGSINIGSSLLIAQSFNPNYFYGNLGSNQYVDMIYNKWDSALGNVTIKGKVYFDNNGNCVYDATDSAAKYWGVIATPGNYLATTDSNGNYNLNVPPGSYTISEVLPELDAGTLMQTCPVSMQYSTGNLIAGSVDTAINFANQFTKCSYTFIYPVPYSIYNCGTPFTLHIFLCNYTPYDIDSDIVQLGVSDSIISVTTTPAYDYFDTVMHNFFLNNIHIPADSCIEINVSGERLCNQGNANPIPLTINVQVPTPCTNSMNYDSISLRIQWGVGVTNLSGQGNINVYPNPFQDQVFVSLDRTGGNGQLLISDIMGKEIMTVPINGTGRASLDLSFLSSGVYVISYHSEQGKISQMIVKD